MTEKKTERRANDDYQTPLHVVEPLLDLIDWDRGRLLKTRAAFVWI